MSEVFILYLVLTHLTVKYLIFIISLSTHSDNRKRGIRFFDFFKPHINFQKDETDSGVLFNTYHIYSCFRQIRHIPLFLFKFVFLKCIIKTHDCLVILVDTFCKIHHLTCPRIPISRICFYYTNIQHIISFIIKQIIR